MSAPRCYLDFNATAPLRAGARQACIDASEITGNPSSIHKDGRDARRAIETARVQVGQLVGQFGERVVFTSGGTEAANLVLSPDLRTSRASAGTVRLLVSATDHAAVLHGHRFPLSRTTILPVDRNGLLDADRLREAIGADGGSPAMLALQAANNETGVIQQVRAAADQVHAAGGMVVCDAVQAIGRVPFSMDASGADAVILSGHKIGGPKGIGAAILAEGVSLGSVLIRGGGQERGLRSGTENVSGIAGFGAAAIEAGSERENGRLAVLRDRLEAGLRSLRDDVIIFGAGAARLANTTCCAVPGFSAETLLMAFDLEGVSISSGSACSSGKVSRSHVLEAMGVSPHISGGALRVSFGWSSKETDADRFLETFSNVMHRMRRRTLPVAA